MSPVLTYRDDGPAARALARLGRAVAPSALALPAVVAPIAVLALSRAGGDSAGRYALLVGWLVVLGGASRGGDLGRDRFAWLVPGLLRAGEYALLLWIGATAGQDGLGAAFALLFALAFHHYDLVYRLRQQGAAPAAWLATAAGGWDGRLVLAWVLLAAGALPAGFYALAATLAALFVFESASSWRRAPVQPQGDAE